MSIKIYQANLAHGTYTDGSARYPDQATILAASGTDLAGCNEVSVGDLSQWDTGFTASGMSRALYNPAYPGAGDGNCLWYRGSTVTLHQTYTRQLVTGVNPYSGVENM